VQVWKPYVKRCSMPPEMQKKATKLIYGLEKKSYEQRLEALGLYSLHRWKLRGNFVETSKILTGKENIDSSLLFQKASTTDLRGHSLK